MFVVPKTLIQAICFTLLLSPVVSAASNQGDSFGDWVYECEAKDPNKELCALTHTIMANDGKSRLLKLTVGKLGRQGELALVALLPLGIYLPGGVVGRVDTGKPFALTLRTCTELGCEGALLVDQDLRWKLKAGKILFISFKAHPRSEAVTLSVSLEGVSAGLETMDEK